MSKSTHRHFLNQLGAGTTQAVSSRAHKGSSGCAVSRRRPTLGLEAPSLLVYMTFIQTKTTGEGNLHLLWNGWHVMRTNESLNFKKGYENKRNWMLEALVVWEEGRNMLAYGEEQLSHIFLKSNCNLWALESHQHPPQALPFTKAANGTVGMRELLSPSAHVGLVSRCTLHHGLSQEIQLVCPVGRAPWHLCRKLSFQGQVLLGWSGTSQSPAQEMIH